MYSLIFSVAYRKDTDTHLFSYFHHIFFTYFLKNIEKEELLIPLQTPPLDSIYE